MLGGGGGVKSSGLPSLRTGSTIIQGFFSAALDVLVRAVRALAVSRRKAAAVSNTWRSENQSVSHRGGFSRQLGAFIFCCVRTGWRVRVKIVAKLA